MRPLTLIYVGSGWGAPDRRTGKGPYALAPGAVYDSPILIIM